MVQFVRIKDLNGSTKKIMECCFSYKLLQKYSWSGRSGLRKGVFKYFKMYKFSVYL